MRFNVTFRCSVPMDLDSTPAGEELAEYLVARFGNHGLNIRVKDTYGDFAWWLEVKDRSPAPCLILGYVGDADYEWLLEMSWLGRMFGRSDADLREDVALKLHDMLTQDANFSTVRWHEGECSDVDWTPTPRRQ